MWIWRLEQCIPNLFCEVNIMVKLMHNLISFNQRWSHDAANDEDKIDEYYECLIECTDNQSSCKRICSDILM